MIIKSKIKKSIIIHRIVMFADMPSSYSPSVFVNGKQFVSWFKSQGYELKILEPFPWKLFRWLAKKKGFQRFMWYLILPIQRFFEILYEINNADIVIVHKGIISMNTYPIFEKLLRLRHKYIIFNFDDAVYEKGIPYVPERILLADAVWVGNHNLAKFSKKYCKKVCVIESAVDCEHYTSKVSYEIHEPLQLIWSGTEFSHQYLEQLREPLKILSKRRRFIFKIISGAKFSFYQPEIIDEWIPFDIQTEIRYLKEADIALMPLPDGPYEKAKENYKTKMYMACGLPIICSPVGINTEYIKDGETGFFAKATEDWVRVIEQLAGSHSTREFIGSSARAYVVEKYDIPIIGAKLFNLFNYLMEEI